MVLARRRDRSRRDRCRGQPDPVAGRLVRTELVGLASEEVEGSLLRSARAAWWHRRVELEREVHALVATVPPWLARRDPLVANAEFQPPGGQLGKSVGCS
jgi:hypothetical protein